MRDMTHLRATAHSPTATRIATLCITSIHRNTLWVWCTYMLDMTHSRVGHAGDGDKGGAGAGGVQLCSSVDTATHCNTLHTLQHTATHCNTIQNTTTRCNVLQHTATRCNTLQHAATQAVVLASSSALW